MEATYKVYVLLYAENNITAINSSAFLPDPTGWVQIDEGLGDRYHHAQGHYLDGPVMDDYGRYNYRLVDGRPERIPEEEKPPIPAPPKSQMEILQEAVDMLIISTLEG